MKKRNQRNQPNRSTRLRECDQVPTQPVTIEEIMKHPTFERGVADVRAGRGFPRDYDQWSWADKSWGYERGRIWATVTPKNIPLKRNGNITKAAIDHFWLAFEEII